MFRLTKFAAAALCLVASGSGKRRVCAYFFGSSRAKSCQARRVFRSGGVQSV